jgi:hypothetical protein
MPERWLETPAPAKRRKGKEIRMFSFYLLTVSNPSQSLVGREEWVCPEEQFSKTFQMWNHHHLLANALGKILKSH